MQLQQQNVTAQLCEVGYINFVPSLSIVEGNIISKNKNQQITL